MSDNKQEFYLGSRKIRAKIDNPDDNNLLNIYFTDNTEIKINKKLYELIVKTEKGNGENINDLASTYIAAKLLKELAEYGFRRYQVESVAMAVVNLTHNFTECKIGEKFGVANSNDIKLSDII